MIAPNPMLAGYRKRNLYACNVWLCRWDWLWAHPGLEMSCSSCCYLRAPLRLETPTQRCGPATIYKGETHKQCIYSTISFHKGPNLHGTAKTAKEGKMACNLEQWHSNVGLQVVMKNSVPLAPASLATDLEACQLFCLTVKQHVWKPFCFSGVSDRKKPACHNQYI